MAEALEMYKCQKCGIIAQVFRSGGGSMSCCGMPMEKLEEKTADKTTEKHVPVVEKTADGFKVTVGTTLHPMTEEHYIEWIEIIADGTVYRKHLKPGDAPEASICLDACCVTAREHCNIHGLWRS